MRIALASIGLLALAACSSTPPEPPPPPAPVSTAQQAAVVLSSASGSNRPISVQPKITACAPAACKPDNTA